ncbi:MAG: nuclear transport factor 2 family protein [Chiayiivirga sp.]|uniref:YybH family protein n=1 Tax=Chiayiivirga sp. TaxID=2041042 RepID=UPI0025BB3741|nr:nuclear transport factor 2 family protein [Chiayiivirga sp.]MCI1729216.1 nuclear transport factor 2 family protein [Chiayiivirga sp.]
MSRSILPAWSMALVFAGSATLAPASGSVPASTAPAATMSVAECEVWNRERSFAQSIERGDAAAFAEHVQVDAVFQAGTAEPQRGRGAVVAAWQPMITGEFPLRWHPGIVSIGGDPDIALSTGPAWVQVASTGGADGKAAARYRLGSFVSTWVRDADGAWRVLFDRSAQPMRDATADEVERVRAALPPDCPRA